MTDPTNVPPGWYQDPAAPGRPRWWDGRGWTEHYAEPAYAPGPRFRSVPAGTRTGTAWIWVLVIGLPVFTILQSIGVAGFIPRILAASLRSAGDPSAVYAVYGDPLYLLLTAASFVVLGLAVVLAWRDAVGLRVRGVDRPFHWAWTFLNPWVYVIGRTVVLRRREAADAWPPLVVWIIGEVIAFLVIMAVYIAAIATAFRGYPGFGG